MPTELEESTSGGVCFHVIGSPVLRMILLYEQVYLKASLSIPLTHTLTAIAPALDGA